MTSTFRHETVLPGAVETVFAELVDPATYAGRYAAAGATDVRVTEVRHDPDGTVTVVSQRSEAGGLPRQVSRLVRGAAQLVQTEHWSAPEADGTRRASWRVETRGVAVDISGTSELRPAAGPDGAPAVRLVESGTVTAGVPLVGALIERVAAEQSGRKLALEWQWLTARLAGSDG